MSKKFKTDPDGKAAKARKGKAPRTTKALAAALDDQGPAAGAAGVEIAAGAENATGEIPLASDAGADVTLPSNSSEPAAMGVGGSGSDDRASAAIPAAAEPAKPAEGKMEQTLTLTKSDKPRKDDRIVIFQGPLHAVQFLRTAFGETVPNTITVTGDFAEPSARAPKVKETPEERKARLAALPKPTLAERVKKAEERAAKLREKLAKKAEQPAGEAVPA